ncbi:MAG: hypothetical protein RIQ43_1611, partial [Pseudomonadota bacterium]
LSPHIRDSAEVRQYQVIQQAPARFLLRVIAREGADTAAFETRMRELFMGHFGAGTDMAFDWCTDIPRLPGGKYMEFVGLKDPA